MIYDTCNYGVSTSASNRRPRPMTGEPSVWRSGWELVAFEMLKMAIEDTKILIGYGLIDREGQLRGWPINKHGEHMTIATMSGPLDHAMLREFWNDPEQGQTWCDLCGFPLPAADVWANLLKRYAR